MVPTSQCATTNKSLINAKQYVLNLLSDSRLFLFWKLEPARRSIHA